MKTAINYPASDRLETSPERAFAAIGEERYELRANHAVEAEGLLECQRKVTGSRRE